ncbi:MAG: esterase family protein [Pirellulaceae bacterium]|nr:esterase family protein [Pirellulaceae bacterium]
MSIDPGCWEKRNLSGRDYILYCPSGCTQLVLYLHDTAITPHWLEKPWQTMLEKHSFGCLIPIDKMSWWTNQIRPHEEESTENWLIQKLLPSVEAELQSFALAPVHWALLGNEMGGAGILRIGYKYAQKFHVLAALSPTIDAYQLFNDPQFGLNQLYPNAEALRQDSPLQWLKPFSTPRYQWVGTDPLDSFWADGAQRLKTKLSASGVRATLDLETTANGHRANYFRKQLPTVGQFLSDSLHQVALSVE